MKKMTQMELRWNPFFSSAKTFVNLKVNVINMALYGTNWFEEILHV